MVAERVALRTQPALELAALDGQAVGPRLVHPGRSDEPDDLGQGAAVVEQSVADVRDQRPEPDGLEAAADVVDLRPLLRDEQHRVALAGEGGHDVRDGLGGTGSGRGVHHDVLTAEHRLDHPALGRVGVEDDPLAGRVRIGVEVGGRLDRCAIGRVRRFRQGYLRGSDSPLAARAPMTACPARRSADDGSASSPRSPTMASFPCGNVPTSIRGVMVNPGSPSQRRPRAAYTG